MVASVMLRETIDDLPKETREHQDDRLVEPCLPVIVVWDSPTTVFGYGQDFGKLQVNEHRLRDIAKLGCLTNS